MNSIAVWGSPGSGKSLIALALANEITRRYKKSVIVISGSKLTPMLPVYSPFGELNSDENSLGQLVLKGVTQGNLRNKIIPSPNNKNLGFMGYVDQDNSLKYQTNLDSTELEELLHLLTIDRTLGESICDLVMFDSASNILDGEFTYKALSMADKVVRVTTPDSKGVSFLNSQLPMISDSKFRSEEHIRVLNNCFEYSPFKQIKKDYDMQYIFPHSKELYQDYLEGGNFKLRGNEKSILKDLCTKVMEE